MFLRYRLRRGGCASGGRTGDVPPLLSSAGIWSPILKTKEIGREEALFRRTDHWLPALGGGRRGGEGSVPQARVAAVKPTKMPCAEQANDERIKA